MRLLRVEHLKKYFDVSAGINHAVDDVTLSIDKGKTMGVVGESGCGKSTLGRTIIRLQNATSGKIYLNDEDITNIKGRELRQVREKMQIVFQDPYSSLNSRKPVGQIIGEGMIAH